MLVFSRSFAIFSVNKLAAVDYTVANRVTEDVSHIVKWSYDNNLPWIPPIAVNTLHTFDDFGSILIGIVIWIINHTN